MSKSPPQTVPPQVSTQGKSRQEQRQNRLAAALRANLHRRKAQATGQAAAENDAAVPEAKIKT